MREAELRQEYFVWMCQLIDSEGYRKYDALLRYLHSVDFHYIHPMDGNRLEDGISLRYRFAYENKYEDACASHGIDIFPCSVLEMMVALALRCEEQIMYDDYYGDRCGLWFWRMIESLGLEDMDNENFDIEYTQDVIFRFLNRKYKRNGAGGLFTVQDAYHNMLSEEIWTQMNLYLNEVIDWSRLI